MKSNRNKLFTSMFVTLAFLCGQAAYGAGAKTLIEMNGGSPSAGLAKSWKKVKDGEYTFELDTSAEIKKGQTLTPGAVKESLETKLGASDGVKVTEKGASAVSVTYTGDEKKFLEKVSKTKIRGKGGDSELAVTDSVSEGGIRAKPTDRAPTANEVKGTILKVTKDQITATVLKSLNASVKENATVKVKGSIKGALKGELFYFVPEKDDKGVWTAKAGSLKQT